MFKHLILTLISIIACLSSGFALNRDYSTFYEAPEGVLNYDAIDYDFRVYDQFLEEQLVHFK